MKTFLARFAQDESGATAIEYGLIAAIVGVGIIAGLGNLKDGLNDTVRQTSRPNSARSKPGKSWYGAARRNRRRAALFVSACRQAPAALRPVCSRPTPV